jgi:hypothetical protein
VSDEIEETAHVDIVGFLSDEDHFFIGHGELPLVYGPRRLRVLSELLFELANEAAQEAERYENMLRCFRTPLGDTFYEVIEDHFVEADNRREAEEFHLDNGPTVNYEHLRKLFPKLEYVNEKGEG